MLNSTHSKSVFYDKINTVQLVLTQKLKVFLAGKSQTNSATKTLKSESFGKR